ncbi:PaaX family transcriptional regulator C-terminal domain-containing protein [Blastococcus sp. TF02A-26]|uniref:PaaX family transcriptional regulator n=1 Tax=Blastococcus sp. TF02A-26 TaxID=2250577 RepID=UPI000DEB1970|nr:PaaX family transcriptional regulator C-terminal domain-containing protein [Blastococcus sp. TF02A-26]RBY90815.1 PaaX family transcriptional regulator [Blastococcus sp. TF02A-26]
MKPRSVVVDLFGDHLRDLGGAARMQALGELLGVFGIGESTARVVLSRMRREGWFTTRREGRQTVYELTERSRRLLDEGRSRILDRGTAEWDGEWRMVLYTVPEAERGERERVRRSLAWLGFGPLAPSVWTSPHPRLEAAAEALAGTSATRVELLTARSGGRDADRRMAARCWDLDTLGRDYAELVAELEGLPPAAELAALPGPEALRRRIELIYTYRHFPFRDPDLPAELLPEGWPGSRAHALFLAAHEALGAAADPYVREVLARHTA